MHASIAKMKEDELEEKIEKWLENVEDNVEGKKETNNNGEVDKKSEVEKKIPNDGNKIEECNGDKQEVEKKSEHKRLSPSKKTKQTFDELFGERTFNTTPKNKISNLDTLDKLLDEATENLDHENASMQINMKIENKEEKNHKNKAAITKVNAKIKNKNNNKKESQTKIQDFFKKKTL